MSHFTVYVFTNENDVEDLLAPYDENIIMDKYIKYTKEEAIADVRKDIEEYKNTLYAEYIADPEAYKERHPNKGHINYLENEFTKRLTWTDEECYEYKAALYDDDMIDAEGNLYSTYNPKSKWDWYAIGGRWDGELLKTIHGNNVNEAPMSVIDWDKTPMPFAFVTPDGEWHERAEMGWWAVTTNDKKEDVWKKEFEDAVNKYRNTCMVTLVDCHI